MKVCLFVVDEDKDLEAVLAGVVDALRRVGEPARDASPPSEGRDAAGTAREGSATSGPPAVLKSTPVLDDLTGRELEVLDLVARGLDNGGIAELLGISPRTVRNHLNSIFSKLNVTYRPQAVVLAREAGLGQETPGFERRVTSDAA